MKRLIPIILILILMLAPVYADDFQDGWDAYDRKNYNTAFEKWKPLAEQGNFFAQYNLGTMYYFAMGVEWSYDQAAKWYRLSAEQGYAPAQSKLGSMYEEGYRNSQGVPQDRWEAKKWYRLSAEQGYAHAQYRLGVLYARIQSYKEAVKWDRMAAAQDYAPAQYNLGWMYAHGKGVTQDYKEAVKWYRLAAEQGESDAQFMLGGMYDRGLGVIQDYVQAHKWLNIAGANGDKVARKNRDLIEKRMTPDQINEAQRLAKAWMSQPSGEESSSFVGQSTQPPPQKKQEIASGTGFLFSTKDYVITNNHVVKEANSILVKFTNGITIKANIVAKDAKNDIAVLKLANASPLLTVPIKLGESSTTRMGDKIFTIGYPASKIMGERPKYSEGVINAVTGIRDDPTFFQISVPIQPGNSGGPLFNARGEVVGITTSSLSLWAAEAIGAIPQNVNYAIKSSLVNNLVSTIPELMTNNKGFIINRSNPENSLSNFIEKVSKNIVLIEAMSN